MIDTNAPNTSNINNSIYQFDISLINTAAGRETRLPIPKGAVEYLEIEDNLANFGFTGKCRIANFYGILQQLNILDSHEVQYIFVDISNTDFKNSGIDDNADLRLSLFATLEQGVEISQNIISKSANYTIEEYFVPLMRKQSIITLIPALETTKGPPGKLIYDILRKLNKTAVSELLTSVNFNNEFMLADEVLNSIALSEIYTGGKVVSVFDVVSELYNYVTFQSNNSGNSTGGPAIMSSTNKLVDGVIKRVFTLKPFSHLTSGLYQRLHQPQFAEDLKDYVTEEFIVGNSLTINYEDVLSKKWIDYTLSESTALDLTVNTIADIEYEDVKYDFSKEMLDGSNPNLPDRSDEERIMTAQIKKKVSDDSLTKQYIRNSLKKSFVLDNIALTFTVPGNTYRKSGKFVKINAPKTDLGEDLISGYWLVIIIKHIFDGDYYTNEYTCVRLTRGGMMSSPAGINPAPIPLKIPGILEAREPELLGSSGSEPELPTLSTEQDPGSVLPPKDPASNFRDNPDPIPELNFDDPPPLTPSNPFTAPPLFNPPPDPLG